MELILDGEPIAITENETEPVTAVMNRVTNDLKERNRVISEIFLDHQPLAGWDDPSLASLTVGQCGRLELVSEEPGKLAHKVLYEIAGFMPRIQQALIETSSRLQSRKEDEGLELLQQVSSTWVELYQGLHNAVQVTGVDWAQIQIDGQTFEAINNELKDYLTEVSSLVEERQFLELSDILEYELATRIPLLEEGIYRIIREIEKKPH